MTISPNKWELDVQGYLNVCNITSATPRQQIRDFAKGVNDLGLWNSMVCWPLRSSQNYGSGTTAFSLGGLGTFNGTLTNGPTWGVDGVTFDASTKHINVPSAAGVYNGQGAGWSVVAVIDTDRTGGDITHTTLTASIGGGTGGRVSINTKNVGSNQFAAGGRRLDADSFVSSTANSTNQRTYLENRSDWNAGSVQLVVNGTAQTSAAYSSGAGNTSATDSQAVMMGNSPTTFAAFTGTISFALICQTLPSLDDAERFRDLYKTTLGTGLGLP
jgi:hypothetical protein